MAIVLIGIAIAALAFSAARSSYLALREHRRFKIQQAKAHLELSAEAESTARVRRLPPPAANPYRAPSKPEPKKVVPCSVHLCSDCGLHLSRADLEHLREWKKEQRKKR